MKYLYALFTAVFTGFLSFWQAGCDTNFDKVFKNSSEHEFNTVTKACNSKKIMFPEGTLLERQGKAIRATLPEGFYFEGINRTDSNEYIYRTYADITCDCTNPSNGKCFPVVSGSFAGCGTELDKPDTCKECKMTVKKAEEGRADFSDGAYDFQIMMGDMEKEANKIKDLPKGDQALVRAFNKMFNEEAPIHPEVRYTSLKQLPPITESLLNDVEVKKNLPLYLSELRLDDSPAWNPAKPAPNGYSLVPINIKNHVGYVLVSAKIIAQYNLPRLLSEEGGGYYCSGRCGTGKCTLQSLAFGKVHACFGCNDGCTLHTK